MREAWIRDRHQLDAGRHELTAAAAAFYGDLPRAAGTHLLSRAAWLPEPVELGALTLDWVDEPPPPAFDGTGPETAHLRAGYASYAEALGALARPKVFENRPAYRLLDADLTTADPYLTFGPGSYFDGVNVGEAVAHELAAGHDDFRKAVGDPRDLSRRPALPAVSTLTVRAEDAASGPEFVLHFRDASKVAHGGGLHQVMPVGVFQPIGSASMATDFDLWRGMVREYAEEFLGRSEEYGESLDYDGWPFYEALTSARREGRIRVHCLGLGVDPLSWATDLLMVAVFDADCFDEHLGALVDTNEEGEIQRVPFDQSTLVPLLDGSRPIQAAGAAVLALAAAQWPGLA